MPLTTARVVHALDFGGYARAAEDLLFDEPAEVTHVLDVRDHDPLELADRHEDSRWRELAAHRRLEAFLKGRETDARRLGAIGFHAGTVGVPAVGGEVWSNGSRHKSTHSSHEGVAVPCSKAFKRFSWIPALLAVWGAV